MKKNGRLPEITACRGISLVIHGKLHGGIVGGPPEPIGVEYCWDDAADTGKRSNHQGVRGGCVARDYPKWHIRFLPLTARGLPINSTARTRRVDIVWALGVGNAPESGGKKRIACVVRQIASSRILRAPRARRIMRIPYRWLLEINQVARIGNNTCAPSGSRGRFALNRRLPNSIQIRHVFNASEFLRRKSCIVINDACREPIQIKLVNDVRANLEDCEFQRAVDFIIIVGRDA